MSDCPSRGRPCCRGAHARESVLKECLKSRDTIFKLKIGVLDELLLAARRPQPVADALPLLPLPTLDSKGPSAEPSAPPRPNGRILALDDFSSC
jgi:hypothetical protein